MWLYNHRETYEGYLYQEVVQEIQAVLSDTMIQIKQRRKNLQQFVVDNWCKKMSQQCPENCPVLMVKVDCKCVSEYMVQKTNNEDKLMSKGTYCGIHSGIIYLHTMSNLSPPPSFCENMSMLMKGFKCTIIQQKKPAAKDWRRGRSSLALCAINYCTRSSLKVKKMSISVLFYFLL